MTQVIPYKPGAILHGAIMGAFRAHGTTFEAWCQANGVSPATARSATYGQSGGEVGRDLLARLIAAAGPAVVEAAYLARLRAHVEALTEGGAAR